MSVKTLAIHHTYCCADDAYVQYHIPREHLSKSTRKFLKKNFRKRDMSGDKEVKSVVREAIRGVHADDVDSYEYIKSDYQFWNRVC